MNKLQRNIESSILTVRGERVILDTDLAAIYRVPVKRINEQVKRNRDRFPFDFCFRLAAKEWKAVRSLRSQDATIDEGRWWHRKYLPHVITEHGAIMAANVLNSKRAVQMSVFVVRAFVRMHGMLADNKRLVRGLAALEGELKKRLDVHETAIVGILQRIMDIVDPQAQPEPKKRRIGFGGEDTWQLS